MNSRELNNPSTVEPLSVSPDHVLPPSSGADVLHDRMIRRERMSAIMIAVLVHALMIVGLAVWTLKQEPVDVATINARPAVIDTPPLSQPPKVKMMRPNKPSPPSPMSPALTAISDVSPVHVPLVEVDTEMFVLGSSDQLGLGLSGLTGDGGEGGATTDLGSESKGVSSLEGHLYDFKQSAAGKPLRYDVGDADQFVRQVKRLHSTRFSEASFNRYFVAPKSLHLTSLAVPFSPASAGPGYFGAADTIKPSGWVAHYRGVVSAPDDGMYRFVGIGDDYLSVFLRKKPVLIAAWQDIQKRLQGRFKPTEPSGEHMSPMQVPLIYGEWMKLRAGDSIPINIAIGERPGGKVGFLLMVEQKGVDYRKAPDGRSILPLFTTVPISAAEKARVTDGFAGFDFEWDNVPVFTVVEDTGLSF